MLLELSTPKEIDIHSKWGVYVGYVGAALSIIIGLIFIGMFFKCRKKNSGHKPIAMDTFKQAQEQGELMEEEL